MGNTKALSAQHERLNAVRYICIFVHILYIHYISKRFGLYFFMQYYLIWCLSTCPLILSPFFFSPNIPTSMYICWPPQYIQVDATEYVMLFVFCFFYAFCCCFCSFIMDAIGAYWILSVTVVLRSTFALSTYTHTGVHIETHMETPESYWFVFAVICFSYWHLQWFSVCLMAVFFFLLPSTVSLWVNWCSIW